MEMSKDISGILREKIGLGNNKKLKENALILAIAGIIILLAGSAFFPAKESKKSETGSDNKNITVNTSKTEETDIEYKLSQLLSSIAGAGKCRVMVTYESTSEVVPFINKNESGSNTDEKDDSGGARKISSKDTEESVVMEEISGSRKPAAAKEILPKALGVVVVCPGGDNPSVKEAITKSIQALFGLAIHKIQVIKGS
jgi:stage III sporulation protein AG